MGDPSSLIDLPTSDQLRWIFNPARAIRFQFNASNLVRMQSRQADPKASPEILISSNRTIGPQPDAICLNLILYKQFGVNLSPSF
jgi:hypothetical protein